MCVWPQFQRRHIWRKTKKLCFYLRNQIKRKAMPTAQNTRNVYRHTVQKAAVIEDLATTRLPIFFFCFLFCFFPCAPVVNLAELREPKTPTISIKPKNGVTFRIFQKRPNERKRRGGEGHSGFSIRFHEKVVNHKWNYVNKEKELRNRGRKVTGIFWICDVIGRWHGWLNRHLFDPKKDLLNTW